MCGAAALVTAGDCPAVWDCPPFLLLLLLLLFLLLLLLLVVKPSGFLCVPGLSWLADFCRRGAEKAEVAERI
jgi:hypothetical protein